MVTKIVQDTMGRYVQLCDMGVEMLAIRYDDWRTSPRKTAEAMLTYCNCLPADMMAVYETLTKDSQAGTVLSQDAVKQHGRVFEAIDLAELNWHLQHDAVIHDADFEVANTLQL